MNGMCDRARALIVEDDRVALIERRNSTRGRHYYIFPGGGVEEGETHQYFQAEITGGTFGAGHRLGMIGETPPEAGSYMAVWIPTVDLSRLPVYPAAVAQIVSEVSAKGWPQKSLAFVDHGED